MPACLKCRMLVNEQCAAHRQALETFGRPIPGPPIGACAVPIVEDYLSHIKRGMTVLEVGCGSWSPVKSHCVRIGAHYEGIDSQKTYYDKEVVATRIENLSELSYPEDHFDLVIGTQTMEHWGRPQDPLPPFYTYRHYWVLKNKAAYILDIQAIKDKPLPRRGSNL